MSQEDVVRAAKNSGRSVSLRVLSKLESGGACRLKTVEAVYQTLPSPSRGDWNAWVSSALAGSARRFAADVQIGKPTSGRATELTKLIDTLPKHTRDGMAELIKNPAGLRLLEGTLKAFQLLTKSIK